MTVETVKKGANSLKFVALAGVSLLALPGVASAADNAPEAPAVAAAPEPVAEVAPETGDREIVVTALKRATSIQQTPISISAVGAETLANQNITDSNSLERVAPSLIINPGSNGGTTITIRGLSASGEPLVGVYYDEVPLGATGGVSNNAGGQMPAMRMFDVERAEVLRGPQGTLYGASSMGGTVRVIMAKPKLDKYEGSIDGKLTTLAGTNGTIGQTVDAMVNVPVWQDKLGLRAVGYYDYAPGYITNTGLGLDNKATANHSYGGRLIARFKPVDTVTIDLMGVYQHRKGYGTDWNYSEYQLTGKRYDQTTLIQKPQTDRMKLFSGTLNWDVGFATLTAVGSYTDRLLTYKFDYTPYFARYETANQTNGLTPNYTGSGSSIPGYSSFVSDCTNTNYFVGYSCDGAGYQKLVNGYGNLSTYQPQSNKTSTEEIRLADDKHKLKWTVGFYHSYRANATESILAPTDPVTGLQAYPSGGLVNGQYVYGKTNLGLDRTIYDTLEQIAGFGEATYEFSDKFNVTGGVRYFNYKKNTTSAVPVPSYIAGNVLQSPLTTGSSESGALWHAGAQYKFNRDVNVYFSASKGYRPGGVNQTLGLPSYVSTYKSDQVVNYEFGVKSSWFDRKVVLNLDVFRMDFSNMQISASYNNAFGFIMNSSGLARAQGIEFDTAFYPVDRLSLHVSGSYIDAKLLDTQGVPAGLTKCPVPYDGSLGCAAYTPGNANDPIPNSPKWTLQASADYSTPVGHDLQIIYHADLSYRASSLTTYNLAQNVAAYPTGPYGTQGGAFLFTNPSFAQVGLRFGLEKDRGLWGVYFFANNLGNAIGIISAAGTSLASSTNLPWKYNGVSARPNVVTSISPRVLGLEFKAKF